MADVTGDGLGSPAVYAFSVTPSDNFNFDHAPRALYVGDGNTTLKVTLLHGDVVTFINVPDGSILPIRAIRVWATGTDAAGIIGLY